MAPATGGSEGFGAQEYERGTSPSLFVRGPAVENPLLAKESKSASKSPLFSAKITGLEDMQKELKKKRSKGKLETTSLFGEASADQSKSLFDGFLTKSDEQQSINPQSLFSGLVLPPPLAPAPQQQCSSLFPTTALPEPEKSPQKQPQKQPQKSGSKAR